LIFGMFLLRLAGSSGSLPPFLVAAALLLAAAVSFAKPYTEQSALEAFSIDDQHGETHTVGADARALLFSRDMDAGAVVKEALAKDGAALLERKDVLYVSDISGMPWFVRQMFAKPSMRDRPYAMLLDEDGELTERFPSVEGKATLILLDQLRVVRIVHIGSATELREALESLPDAI